MSEAKGDWWRGEDGQAKGCVCVCVCVGGGVRGSQAVNNVLLHLPRHSRS